MVAIRQGKEVVGTVSVAAPPIRLSDERVAYMPLMVRTASDMNIAL